MDVTVVRGANPSARRADLSDSDELARLRWIWRAVEREERGDPDQFRDDFVTWIAERHRTHVPFLVEMGGRAVGMAWLVIVERSTAVWASRERGASCFSPSIPTNGYKKALRPCGQPAPTAPYAATVGQSTLVG